MKKWRFCHVETGKPVDLGVVGSILIDFWYILFRRLPSNICESFNSYSFMQTGF